MNINQKFLELFKRLEINTIKIYDNEIGYEMNKKPTFHNAIQELKEKGIYPYNKYSDDFDYCSKIRNLFSHRPINIIIVSEYAYKLLERLNNMVENPLRAIDICITKNNIYSKSLKDNIKDTIKVMREKTYTHIPIVENNKIVGVFCEKTLFDYISKEEISSLDLINDFNDIKQYLNIANYSTTIKIIKRDLKIDKIIKMFKESFEMSENLECLFITTDGTTKGDIVGLITIWDILNKYI